MHSCSCAASAFKCVYAICTQRERERESEKTHAFSHRFHMCVLVCCIYLWQQVRSCLCIYPPHARPASISLLRRSVGWFSIKLLTHVHDQSHTTRCTRDCTATAYNKHPSRGQQTQQHKAPPHLLVYITCTQAPHVFYDHKPTYRDTHTKKSNSQQT